MPTEDELEEFAQRYVQRDDLTAGGLYQLLSASNFVVKDPSPVTGEPGRLKKTLRKKENNTVTVPTPFDCPTSTFYRIDSKKGITPRQLKAALERAAALGVDWDTPIRFSGFQDVPNPLSVLIGSQGERVVRTVSIPLDLPQHETTTEEESGEDLSANPGNEG